MSRNGRILSPPRPAGPHVVRRRFQGILGKRRTLENLAVLGQAHSAYMGLKRSAKAIRGRGANIFTQWVGDPDALGSAVVLTAILRDLGAEEVRILTGSLGHPQNRNLVARCGIVLHDPNRDRLRGGLHCMVDTSPPLGHPGDAGRRPGQGLLLRGRPPRGPRGGRGELPGEGRAPRAAAVRRASRWARPPPSWP